MAPLVLHRWLAIAGVLQLRQLFVGGRMRLASI
jgi:hypothetical protein